MNPKRSVIATLAVASLCWVALSSLAASPAQAYKWMIEGSTVASGSSENISIALEKSTTAVFHGKVLGKAITITATGLNAGAGTKISQLNNEARTSGTLELTGVTVDEPFGCTIKNNKITTFNLVAEVREVDKTIFNHWAPETGTTLANVVVEGCGVAGTYPLNGAIYSTVESPKFEAVSQLQQFSKEIQEAATGSLTLGSEPADLTMRAYSSLSGANSGKKWGYE